MTNRHEKIASLKLQLDLHTYSDSVIPGIPAPLTPPEALLKQQPSQSCIKVSSSPPKHERRVSFDLARNQVLKLPSMSQVKKVLERRASLELEGDTLKALREMTSMEPLLEEKKHSEGATEDTQDNHALSLTNGFNEPSVSESSSIPTNVTMTPTESHAVVTKDDNLIPEKATPSSQSQGDEKLGQKKRHSGKKGKHRRRGSRSSVDESITSGCGPLDTENKPDDMRSWGTLAMIAAGGGEGH